MTSRIKGFEKNGSTVKSHALESIWTRAFTSNSEWPDKEEFLDVIYWFRQALGIIIGLVWGLIPLKGFVALLLFVLVNAGLIYLYFTNFQHVDEEEYGGAWELTKEGFMTSFAGFLPLFAITRSVSVKIILDVPDVGQKRPKHVVTWIIIYSGLHFE